MCERASAVEATGVVEDLKGGESTVCSTCLDHFFGFLWAHAVEQLEGVRLAVDGSSDVVEALQEVRGVGLHQFRYRERELLLRGRGQAFELGHAKQALDDRSLAAVIADVHALAHRLEFSALHRGHATEGAVVLGHDHEHAFAEVVFNDTRPCRGPKRVVLGQALRGAWALLPSSSTVLSGLTRLSRGPRLTRLLLGCRLGPAVGGGLP